MSPKEEAQQVNEQILAAAARGDFAPFVNALDDEVEVFDHVPYLFEGKGRFLEYLQSAVAGAECNHLHLPSVLISGRQRFDGVFSPLPKE